MTKLRILSFVFAASLALLASLSPGDSARAEPLNLVGTGDGLEIFRDLAVAYSAAHPGASALVPPSIGSGGAIAAVGGGRERIGRIARALSPVELASGLISAPVFDIPTAFYVHKAVPVRALSSAELRGIFEGSITNWSALGGPNLRVRVVRREENDSSLIVLRATLPEFRAVTMTERSKMALTTQEAISSIRDNEGAIGFGPYSMANAEILGPVSVDGQAPTSRDYPAKVSVALIWREGKRDSDIEAFLRFLATPEARRVITSHGAIPSKK
jgi:phosphate transport system substrate-binding protein